MFRSLDKRRSRELRATLVVQQGVVTFLAGDCCQRTVLEERVEKLEHDGTRIGALDVVIRAMWYSAIVSATGLDWSDSLGDSPYLSMLQGDSA